MKAWLRIFAVALVIYAGFTTYALFEKNPLPFPDRGHSCFAVPDERAARVVLTIFSEIGGLDERFTFEPLPTHQMLMWDNTTVLIWHDELKDGMAANGRSLVVQNPTTAAHAAANILKQAGYTATIHENLIPDAGDKLVIIESDAFVDWVLVFRKHILKMGSPPNKRKLSE